MSYLVRLWSEPRQGGSGPLVRVYVRNLQTGADEYVTDPASLSERLFAQFDREVATPTPSLVIPGIDEPGSS